MPKFRKKPVVIEAFQMTKEVHLQNHDYPDWLSKAWHKAHGEGGFWWDSGKNKYICGTLEGIHVVGWDDFIIQGVKGEIYACKPDIFKATYDPVT